MAATKRGEEALRTQPWAVSVKYDRRYSRLVVKLNKGTILTVPTAIVPELKGLKPDDLPKVSVLPPGFDLDWEHLDFKSVSPGCSPECTDAKTRSHRSVRSAVWQRQIVDPKWSELAGPRAADHTSNANGCQRPSLCEPSAPAFATRCPITSDQK